MFEMWEVSAYLLHVKVKNQVGFILRAHKKVVGSFNVRSKLPSQCASKEYRLHIGPQIIRNVLINSIQNYKDKKND